MTPRKEKALRAVLQCRTRKEAAAAAGISPRTLRDYFRDPEFSARLKEESAAILDDAKRQLQGKLAAAIDRLGDIAEGEEANAAQVSAGRAILEFALKYTEFSDILQELEDGGPDVL